MNERTKLCLQNADKRPRLHRRKQNICFVISISAVILKLMIKITFIFGSSRFLRIAWYETFSLSDHLLASLAVICISPVLRSRRANAHLLVMQVQRLDESQALELKSNPRVNPRTHLIESRSCVCLKFGKTSYLCRKLA